jgi:hypothetical protein
MLSSWIRRIEVSVRAGITLAIRLRCQIAPPAGDCGASGDRSVELGSLFQGTVHMVREPTSTYNTFHLVKILSRFEARRPTKVLLSSSIYCIEMPGAVKNVPSMVVKSKVSDLLNCMRGWRYRAVVILPQLGQECMPQSGIRRADSRLCALQRQGYNGVCPRRISRLQALCA